MVMQRTGMSGQRNDGNRIQAVLHLIGSYVFCGFHAAHERHRNVHLNGAGGVSSHGIWHPRGTYQDNVKWSVLLDPGLERLDSQRSVLGDFDNVAIFFENLHR